MHLGDRAYPRGPIYFASPTVQHLPSHRPWSPSSLIQPLNGSHTRMGTIQLDAMHGTIQHLVTAASFAQDIIDDMDIYGGQGAVFEPEIAVRQCGNNTRSMWFKRKLVNALLILVHFASPNRRTILSTRAAYLRLIRDCLWPALITAPIDDHLECIMPALTTALGAAS